MPNARIVTDSAADLTPEVAEELGIAIVPHRIRLGTRTLLDEPGLRTADFYRQMAKDKVSPVVVAPTWRQFTKVYSHLARDTDEIISIHISSRLSQTVPSANQGRTAFLGRCRINVIDSQFISRALGIIVVEAAKAARNGASGPEIVRLARGLIPRTYFAFCVESLAYLRQSGLLSQRRNAQDEASRRQSLFLMEDGGIAPLRRTRSRGTVVECLYEFVEEFPELQQLFILYSGVGPKTDEIETLLGDLYPRQALRRHIYGPTLSAYIGPMALGIVAFEGEGP